jgi:hypothetical protein
MGWRQDDPGNILNSLQLIRDGAESRAEPRADKVNGAIAATAISAAIISTEDQFLPYRELFRPG